MAKNVIVVGAQWGDEGKGKIVDLLADRRLPSGAARSAGRPQCRPFSTSVVGRNAFILQAEIGARRAFVRAGVEVRTSATAWFSDHAGTCSRKWANWSGRASRWMAASRLRVSNRAARDPAATTRDLDRARESMKPRVARARSARPGKRDRSRPTRTRWRGAAMRVCTTCSTRKRFAAKLERGAWTTTTSR